MIIIIIFTSIRLYYSFRLFRIVFFIINLQIDGAGDFDQGFLPLAFAKPMTNYKTTLYPKKGSSMGIMSRVS